MSPEYFGAESRRLFGTFHARNPASAPGRAVVLCNAFGREGIQLHRMFRILAERLSRTGSDVLRFDYYGTGDSAGDDNEGDLAGWTDDVVTAQAELLRRVPGSEVVLVGARLGANIAQRAAERIAPARLVMLDPILEGPDYLDLLQTQHLQTLIETERARWPVEMRSFRSKADLYLAEASGFAISRNLCDQLRAIRFTPASAARQASVICDSKTSNGQQLASLCASQSPAIRVAQFASGVDWAGSLVPPQVINLMVAEAGNRP
jgi:alpha/beta superfamily hydrolase